MSARKGFASIIVVLIITFPLIILYIVTWAPWVTDNFAYQKASKSLNSSCRILNQDEYSTPVINPLWKQPSIPERLGLVPSFGQDTTLYVLCNDTSSENIYFVSFFGKVSLKESKPIPRRVLDEVPQNTIEKIDETVYPNSIGANWKTYENKNLGFLVKYPDKVVLGEVEKGENTMIVFNNYSELGIQPNFDSRPGNELENRSIYISISVELVKENTTLEQYLNQKYPDSGGNNYGAPSYQNQKAKMKSLEIGGETGLLAEKGMMFENISRNAWVKKGNKVFIFSAYGSGETGTYVSDIAVETFNQILPTFKFL